MARKLNRSNLHDLRQQIEDSVMSFPEIKTVIEEGEIVQVPETYQIIAYKSFTIEGKLDLDGQLVII